MDRKIDFLIIGAQKSGTTTLYNWLRQHPGIFLPETKEILYFAKDEFYQQGEKYLDVFYKKMRGQTVIGGAYVHLMYFPYMAQRIYDYNPKMKMIALLRNPIDRAYSAYWFARSNGWETCRTFEDALEKEDERLSGSYEEQAELTYLTHGHYAEQLQRYLGLFAREQLHIVLTERLRAKPEDVLSGALEFLGVPPHHIEQIDLQDSNRASSVRFLNIQKILLSKDAWYKKFGRKVLPASVRMAIRRYVKNPLINWNRKPFQYPPMHPVTRKRLQALYAPYNRELSRLINQDLEHWNETNR